MKKTKKPKTLRDAMSKKTREDFDKQWDAALDVFFPKEGDHREFRPFPQFRKDDERIAEVEGADWCVTITQRHIGDRNMRIVLAYFPKEKEGYRRRLLEYHLSPRYNYWIKTLSYSLRAYKNRRRLWESIPSNDDLEELSIEIHTETKEKE